MSAWIMKKKSGSSMVRVRQYNKRYFTIDFDLQVLFYAHNTNAKKVNAVVPFADIVEVRRPEVNLDDVDKTSECSRQSKVSFIRRMSSGRLGSGKSAEQQQEQEQFALTVTIKSKTMELMCSSAGEAIEWFQALNAAKDMGGGDARSLPAGRASDSEGSDGNTADVAADAIVVDTGATAGYPNEERARPPPMPSRAALPPSGRGVPPAEVGAATEQEEVAETLPPKPPVRGSLWDLGTETEEGKQDAVEAPKAGVAAEETVQAVTSMISPDSSNLSPGGLQAADFGFDAIEPSDSDSEPSPHNAKRPSGSGVDSSGVCVAGPSATGGSGVPAAFVAAERSSYVDRNEGLSLQQRLANLEFSDDEEDDDDPLGLGKSRLSED